MADKGVVMLVGAGDAIGAAVARRLAGGGYKVCIGRRDCAKAHRLGEPVEAEGRRRPTARAVSPRESPAQAMARELVRTNFHVVHLLIDAGVHSEAIHARMKAATGIDAREIPPDSLTKMGSIADAYWFAHHQGKDGWTHELDLRPSVEN